MWRGGRGLFLVTLDPEGNRTSVETPKDPTTAFEYDDLGKLTKVTQPPPNPDLDPTPPVTAYAYDEHRNRVRLTDASLAPRWRATYCNSFLFPVLFARRTLDRLLGREGSDVGFLPAPLEWAFKRALLVEAALVRAGISFPIGASVVALARKAG